MFTLDMRKIPITSAKDDDNGVYVPKGTVKKSYVYNEEGSRMVHMSDNGVWYFNQRDQREYHRVNVREMKCMK